MSHDWRKILVKYIDHVGSCEGVDYLPSKLSGLTDIENAALARAASEGVCTPSHKHKLIAFAEKLEAQN